MAFLDFLHRVATHSSLTAAEAEQALGHILDGEATTAQIASFLTALRMKGETAGELLGLARAMRARSLKVELTGVRPPVIDTCGTGGDTSGSFNISTVAALVVAGAGVPVAKHGNRSMASHCGSADILEALGVKIALTPAQMGDCLRRAGIGFLFAPALHPAMKNAGPARAELKMRTVLNLLGPLTNPASAPFQLIGAPSEHAARLMAETLAELGTSRAYVVHGSDGMDEVTTTGSTLVLEIAFDQVREHVWTPEDFGIRRATLADLAAPAKDDNVRLAQAVLAGEAGAPRDIVVLNAAAALMVCGVAAGPREAVAKAGEAIDSGAARGRLEALVRESNAA
ncbi:MAG: anthranilate phosphoribosyltransferase [Bryobacterales bacterium]|nr:anthranilate phosphoribosyltransferase [Bryobacterales bacterium]